MSAEMARLGADIPIMLGELRPLPKELRREEVLGAICGVDLDGDGGCGCGGDGFVVIFGTASAIFGTGTGAVEIDIFIPFICPSILPTLSPLPDECFFTTSLLRLLALVTLAAPSASDSDAELSVDARVAACWRPASSVAGRDLRREKKFFTIIIYVLSIVIVMHGRRESDHSLSLERCIVLVRTTIVKV
mmetsp:Transcript_32526/g.68388  ORF Transcript_32526/g.68388 Transcript_32526/m.68388 type:complete len:190 (-) Transcript_32526:49-618(-)